MTGPVLAPAPDCDCPDSPRRRRDPSPTRTCYGHIRPPFLWHWNGEEHLSFVWDGVDRYVEVSPDAFGEPVRWLIPVEPVGTRPDLAAFARLCEAWAAEHADVVAAWYARELA